jgi:L-seryl-tRNA(Ser) seleniumtransferase
MSDTTSSLRYLPAVNAVLEHPGVSALIDEAGREPVLAWVRDALDAVRSRLADGELVGDKVELLDAVADEVAERAVAAAHARIGKLINATGVVLHTGLGRAQLSASAKAALVDIAGAGNVEVDLETTRRRYRGHQLQSAWHTLTGAEDSLVVNNNAAATLLALQALCAGREVVISRGQLIEIGGSFRLPEIFELSGVTLREVGTTNRTKLADYERAIGPNTAAVMHVHTSNYRVVGFTSTPGIDELAPLAHAHGVIAIDDIGSGCLVDVTRYGLPAEPTFRDSLEQGADVSLGSGDKLLGGPQAGIILGNTECVSKIRSHPLARAARVDKLTLGALSATLDSYLRNTAEEDIPTIAMLAATQSGLLERAHAIRDELGDLEPLHIEVQTDTATVGGGSLPGSELPTAVLSLTHDEISPDELAVRLRLGTIRVFPRIQQDAVYVDLRSVSADDDSGITLALRLLAGRA